MRRPCFRHRRLVLFSLPTVLFRCLAVFVGFLAGYLMVIDAQFLALQLGMILVLTSTRISRG